MFPTQVAPRCQFDCEKKFHIHTRLACATHNTQQIDKLYLSNVISFCENPLCYLLLRKSTYGNLKNIMTLSTIFIVCHDIFQIAICDFLPEEIVKSVCTSSRGTCLILIGKGHTKLTNALYTWGHLRPEHLYIYQHQKQHHSSQDCFYP